MIEGYRADDLVVAVGAPPGATNNASNAMSGRSVTVANQATVEQEYWNTIKSSTDAQDFRDYLKEYPKGSHAVIARSSLRRLEAAGKQNIAGPPKKGGAPEPTKAKINALVGPKPGEVVKNNVGIELVFVPPGSFDMGSTDGRRNEKQVQRVTIAQGFYMGKYEVTQAQWQAVMGSSNLSYFTGDDKLPVDQISWNDAQEFINKLNETNDGYKYSLPREAEWEYACRAGTTGDYYAQDVNDIGWYYDNADSKTHRVGSKQANAFGIYDMSGNVWEWCRDWYVSTYEGAPTDGSARLSGGEQKWRVIRGGSWVDYAETVRSALRHYDTPGHRSSNHGFRLVAVERPGNH